ncbi:MAG: putative metal-binding motif-containing protein [Myxococcota bacterium]
MLIVTGWLGTAHAQAVPEGDFESAGKLTGWVQTAGGPLLVDEIDSTILSSRVMEIDRGNPDVVMCSGSFTVTRDQITALMHALDNNGRTDWWIEPPGGGARLAEDNLAPNDTTAYTTTHLDLGPLCGQQVRVCVEPEQNDDITYDAFVLDRAPCSAWDDLDGDGYCPDGQDLNADASCADPGEWDAASVDCAEGDGGVHPGAAEDCDGADDDCDGQIDEGFDVDGDGYTSCGGDCDDGNGAVHPGAAESCNGIDDDGEGGVDEGFDVDTDGYTACGGDCDDGEGAVHPNAAEACNSVDDDCDELVDEDFNHDNDEYRVCDGDCDDEDVNVHPNASEQCNDRDDDCDGQTDEDVSIVRWWPDADTDGYGDQDATAVEDCRAPDGHVDNGQDCDDTDPDIHPTAPDEAVDGVDDDCDGIDGHESTDPIDTSDTGGGGGSRPLDEVVVAHQVGCGCGTGRALGSGPTAWLGVAAAVAIARRRR